jgi:hypothetical protein
MLPARSLSHLGLNGVQRGLVQADAINQSLTKIHPYLIIRKHNRRDHCGWLIHDC